MQVQVIKGLGFKTVQVLHREIGVWNNITAEEVALDGHTGWVEDDTILNVSKIELGFEDGRLIIRLYEGEA